MGRVGNDTKGMAVFFVVHQVGRLALSLISIMAKTYFFNISGCCRLAFFLVVSFQYHALDS